MRKRSQVDAGSLAVTLIFHPSPAVNKNKNDGESDSPPAQHPPSPPEQGEEHPLLTVPFMVQQATDLSSGAKKKAAGQQSLIETEVPLP